MILCSKRLKPGTVQQCPAQSDTSFGIGQNSNVQFIWNIYVYLQCLSHAPVSGVSAISHVRTITILILESVVDFKQVL